MSAPTPSSHFDVGAVLIEDSLLTRRAHFARTITVAEEVTERALTSEWDGVPLDRVPEALKVRILVGRTMSGEMLCGQALDRIVPARVLEPGEAPTLPLCPQCFVAREAFVTATKNPTAPPTD